MTQQNSTIKNISTAPGRPRKEPPPVSYADYEKAIIDNDTDALLELDNKIGPGTEYWEDEEVVPQIGRIHWDFIVEVHQIWENHADMWINRYYNSLDELREGFLKDFATHVALPRTAPVLEVNWKERLNITEEEIIDLLKLIEDKIDVVENHDDIQLIELFDLTQHLDFVIPPILYFNKYMFIIDDIVINKILPKIGSRPMDFFAQYDTDAHIFFREYLRRLQEGEGEGIKRKTKSKKPKRKTKSKRKSKKTKRKTKSKKPKRKTKSKKPKRKSLRR